MSKNKIKKEKKFPVRTCIGCGNKANKMEMVRLVRDSEGNVLVDSTGKVRGRGANFCENIECFDKAVKKNAITRALALDHKLEENVVSELREDFLELLYQREFRRGKKTVTLRVKKNDLIDVIK